MRTLLIRLLGTLFILALAACGDDAPGIVGDAGPSCDDPLLLCGSTCVDPRFDPANCGACGAACGEIGRAHV